MSTREKIKEDLKKSLQEKDTFKLSILRMVNAALQNKEKEKRMKMLKDNPEMTDEELDEKAQLTEEEVIAIILSEIKKRKDSIEQYTQGGREDLAEGEKKELEFLMEYAPEQMPEDEVRGLAQKVIEEVDATGPQDTGKVMGALMPQIKGRAEGDVVSKMVQEELSKKS